MATYRWQIRSGPGKAEFLENITYRKYPEHSITFLVHGGPQRKEERFTAEILTVGRPWEKKRLQPEEEGHEYRFLAMLLLPQSYPSDFIFVVGTYNTKTRTGSIEELTRTELHETPLRRLLFRF
jgi:hypothetical protein